MLLQLDKVSKEYASPGVGEGLRVLAGIDLNVDAAESIAIVGRSGSGKSTLLNIIGTLDRPTSGKVKLEGRDLSGLDESELAGVRSQQIGFIFQLHHLLPQCTILENVLVPTLANGKSDADGAVKRAEKLLKWVGLEQRLDHKPGQLSGGERQRVAVVRALINKPRLLLADEPTGSLDRTAAENLTELLVKLREREQVAIIMVTHAPDLAARMARVYELKNGQLAEAKSS